MKYVISRPGKPIQETISIPSSKSISNRFLIMQALAGEHSEPQNLSDSDDTRALQAALQSGGRVRDIGHAGTAMRFLTAFYAVKQAGVVLTGSERMKQRPVGPLVDALRQLGGRISYLEREGCPPLQIEGGGMSGGAIKVDGGISSQFISALMMVAPRLEGGLRMHLEGDVVSTPYIRMTLELMRAGGVRVLMKGREIRVEEGPYRFGKFTVESDWSGASYWFQVAALLPGSDIFLPHLHENSLQGDAVLVDLFSRLGVESSFRDGGLFLKSGREADRSIFKQDFTACPDLVQTCAASLCALGIPFHFTGTRTLRVKETDRIAALQAELGKLGFPLEADARGDRLSWNGKRGASQEDVLIQTYHDHRMALAFAPLSLALGPLSIDDPMVVSKSYPRYWEDLRQAGFTVSEP